MSQPNPEQTASIFSILLHHYLDSVIMLASQAQHLSFDQLPPLADYDWSKNLIKTAQPVSSDHNLQILGIKCSSLDDSVLIHLSAKRELTCSGNCYVSTVRLVVCLPFPLTTYLPPSGYEYISMAAMLILRVRSLTSYRISSYLHPNTAFHNDCSPYRH